eukprot:2479973-Pleurochrysis_carterae.AAC.1
MEPTSTALVETEPWKPRRYWMGRKSPKSSENFAVEGFAEGMGCLECGPSQSKSRSRTQGVGAGAAKQCMASHRPDKERVRDGSNEEGADAEDANVHTVALFRAVEWSCAALRQFPLLRASQARCETANDGRRAHAYRIRVPYTGTRGVVGESVATYLIITAWAGYKYFIILKTDGTRRRFTIMVPNLEPIQYYICRRLWKSGNHIWRLHGSLPDARLGASCAETHTATRSRAAPRLTEGAGSVG